MPLRHADLWLGALVTLTLSGCNGCRRTVPTDDTGNDLSGDDRDGDGYAAPDDCDDEDPLVFPGAPEVWDGRDQDCDGTVDDLHYDNADACMTGDDRWLLGASVEPIGPLDADGRTVVFVGAPGFRPDGSTGDVPEGAALFLRGGEGVGSGEPLENVHLIVGTTQGARFGVEGAVLGDVDGDGELDLALVSDRYGGFDVGQPDAVGLVSLVLSSDGGYLAVSRADEAPVLLSGEEERQRLGSTTTAYGDLDGDGLDDFGLAGRLNADNEGMFVYHGRSSTDWPARLHPADADGLLAEARSLDTYAIQSGSAGDFNGDGYQDALVGVGTADEPVLNAGVVYLALGGPDGVGWRETLAAQADFAIQGTNEGDGVTGEYLGWSMTHAPDLDDDGDDEIVFSGIYDSTSGEDAGAVYLVLGEPDPSDVPGTTVTAIPWAPAGLAASAKIVPPTDHDVLGWSLDIFPDLNGDGYPELGLSSPYASADDFYEPGRAWVIDLHEVVGQGVVNVDDHALLTVSGTRDRHGVGTDIRTSDDLNGDGRPDLVVGAYLDDAGGDRRGSVCVFLDRTEDEAP